jgi:hypothetical protein
VKYQGESLLNNQYTLKNKEQKGKTGAVQDGYQWECGRVNREAEGGQIWVVYFVYTYKN